MPTASNLLLQSKTFVDHSWLPIDRCELRISLSNFPKLWLHFLAAVGLLMRLLGIFFANDVSLLPEPFLEQKCQFFNHWRFDMQIRFFTCNWASSATKSFSKPSCFRCSASAELRSFPISVDNAAFLSCILNIASATSRWNLWISPAALSFCSFNDISWSKFCQ